MPIQLGSYTFDENFVSFTEKFDEVGGKDGRSIRIKGLIPGFETVEEIEAELDNILAAASKDNPDTLLRVRTDRQMRVRREAFERQVQRGEMIGAFTLALEADYPREESVAEISVAWSVDQSGAMVALGTNGNHKTCPVITLEATGNLVNPAISDGVRTILYKGSVNNGQTLVFDGVNKRVTLEGVDRTWLSKGDFPCVVPEGSTFTYTDAIVSAHSADITITYRDRWW